MNVYARTRPGRLGEVPDIIGAAICPKGDCVMGVQRAAMGGKEIVVTIFGNSELPKPLVPASAVAGIECGTRNDGLNRSFHHIVEVRCLRC